MHPRTSRALGISQLSVLTVWALPRACPQTSLIPAQFGEAMGHLDLAGIQVLYKSSVSIMWTVFFEMSKYLEWWR